MTRECPHCSAPLEDGETVCPSCGRNVTADPLEAQPVDGAEEPPREDDPAPALDAASQEVAEETPEREIRFDAQDDPYFQPEAAVLEDERPGGVTAPTRFVVFRCARCQMPMAPGTTACLRCGLQLAQPVPRILIHASSQVPILRQGEYHCPECQAVLAPQSNLCTNCGAEFVSAVPPVNWGTPGVGATGGNAALWTRPVAVAGTTETWKIAAAVIAVVAFAAVLLMIGALSAGRKTVDTTVTTGGPGSTPVGVGPVVGPVLPPVVMTPGTGGTDNPVHASPVGTWVRGSDSLRLDEIGGAWVDAPDVTGSKSKVNLNWTLVDTNNGQVVHVQGPGYAWDFAWNFGPDGSETLTQSQWGELRRQQGGQKHHGGKSTPKPPGAA